MIKECNVISYNKFLNILVFEYDGKQIQTTVDNESKTVFVEYKNGQYKIVGKDEYDKNIQENRKKEKRISKANKTIGLDIVIEAENEI